MFFQMLFKEKRVAQFYTLVIFLALAAVFLSVTFFMQVNMDRIDRNAAEITERNLVEVEKVTIASKINRRVSDILYVADSFLLGSEMFSDYTLIERPWIAFSNRYGIFDQIRYIDQNGDEKVRINYGADGAYAVAQVALQNKADRHYFINAISLQKDDVFISQLDLNIEDGQIEQPIKPTLRLATPLFDAAGNPEGIVILNYAAEDMLRQVRAVASGSAGEVYLLNLDGYWLYNSADSAVEWAFMYEDHKDERFSEAFPAEWDAIAAGDESGFLQTENGVFTYTGISLETEIAGNSDDAVLFGSSGSFYIVSYIRADSETGRLFSQGFLDTLGRVVMNYLSIYFLLSGIAFVLASFVAVNRAQRREIKYFSEFDAMTGVYNRRSGYGKLNALKKNAEKGGCRIALCFIDINGLKDVNDQLGHDAGDELIRSIVNVIKESVRGNDFVARLGGDEFLIVFEGLDAAGAETVWDRILQRLERINAGENRAYVLSVSHGIAGFTCDDGVPVDEVITRADEKMYEEKREIKRTLRVVRGKE
jgi:diguanylate cyclase (GGDEF)-like protein